MSKENFDKDVKHLGNGNKEQKEFKILIVKDNIQITYTFVGKSMPEKQSKEWNFYKDYKGTIFHVARAHIVSIKEKSIAKKGN